MIIYGNFLLEEHVVQIEHVRNSGEGDGVNKAVTCQECLELCILDIRLKIVIEFTDVKVLLSIVKLVNIVIKVPIGEVLLQPELAHFEWSVVNKGQNISL